MPWIVVSLFFAQRSFRISRTPDFGGDDAGFRLEDESLQPRSLILCCSFIYTCRSALKSCFLAKDLVACAPLCGLAASTRLRELCSSAQRQAGPCARYSPFSLSILTLHSHSPFSLSILTSHRKCSFLRHSVFVFNIILPLSTLRLQAKQYLKPPVPRGCCSSKPPGYI